MSSLKSHRELFAQLRRSRLGTVLAKLERFSAPDLTASLGAVALNQQVAVIVRHVSVPIGQPVADEILPCLVIIRHAWQITSHPRIFVSELRRHRFDAG